MIKDLVKYDDPILKNETEKFDFTEPQMDPVELSRELAETMIFNNGIGLAANQIGRPYSVFAMMAEKIIVCFNPKIVDMSLEKIYLDEGCLSYPGLDVKVQRSKKIKVRYTEPSGEVVTKVFDGMTSRVFQHELDHLDGTNFISRATGIHKTQALTKWKKVKRNDKKATFHTAV